MSAFSVVRLFIIMPILLLCSSTNDTLAKPCPGPNKTPHKDGTYDFTYESWVKKFEKRDHWDFGRCVENNLQTREMFVDWKNTFVRGWAKPNDIVDAVIESPSSDHELIPTELWYGSEPSMINAPYREAKSGKKSSPGSVRSLVHMAVPEDSENPEKTLVSIEVEFISEVNQDGGLFKYRYTWSDALAKNRAPIRFQWESLMLILSASNTRPPERLQLSIENPEVSFVSKIPPAYGVTPIQFLDRKGKQIGMAPVATYYPSDVKLNQVSANGPQ